MESVLKIGSFELYNMWTERRVRVIKTLYLVL